MGACVGTLTGRLGIGKSWESLEEGGWSPSPISGPIWDLGHPCPCCRTGGAVSCFGMAPSWPCAHPGGTLWGSCPFFYLPLIMPQVFIKHLLYTQAGTYCLVEENSAKQMND